MVSLVPSEQSRVDVPRTIFSKRPPSRVWVFSERITFYPTVREPARQHLADRSRIRAASRAPNRRVVAVSVSPVRSTRAAGVCGSGVSKRTNGVLCGIEGIVSKRTDAPYRSRPSMAWFKVKNPASDAGVVSARRSSTSLGVSSALSRRSCHSSNSAALPDVHCSFSFSSR